MRGDETETREEAHGGPRPYHPKCSQTPKNVNYVDQKSTSQQVTTVKLAYRFPKPAYCWLAISQIGGARYSLLPPYPPQAVLVAARSICGSLTSEAYLNSLRQIHAMHATHDGRLALRAVSLDQLVALRACDEVHARGV